MEFYFDLPLRWNKQGIFTAPLQQKILALYYIAAENGINGGFFKGSLKFSALHRPTKRGVPSYWLFPDFEKLNPPSTIQSSINMVK